MYMSRPAIRACGQLSLVQPATWPCPFQSPTVKPSKFMRFLSTSVIRPLLPVCLTPFQLENEIMMVCTPASMAGT